MPKAALGLSVSRETAGRTECLERDEEKKRKKKKRLKRVLSWAYTQVHGM